MDITPNVRGAMYEIPGVLTLGQAYRLDASRTEDHYELVEGFNLTSGKHQLSFGGNAHWVRLDARLANRFSGIFLFPTLQDFLRASPDVFIQAFGEPRTHLTTIPLGFWLQDRWQVRTGLTLEAGLRYDRQQMPTGIPVSSRNLSPRLGMAWHPNGNAAFVVRAGYGLFFDRYPLAFLNDAIQKNGRQGFEQYLVGSRRCHRLASFPRGYIGKTYPGGAAIDLPGGFRFSDDLQPKTDRGAGTQLGTGYNRIGGSQLGSRPPSPSCTQYFRHTSRPLPIGADRSLSLSRRCSDAAPQDESRTLLSVGLQRRPNSGRRFGFRRTSPRSSGPKQRLGALPPASSSAAGCQRLIRVANRRMEERSCVAPRGPGTYLRGPDIYDRKWPASQCARLDGRLSNCGLSCLGSAFRSGTQPFFLASVCEFRYPNHEDLLLPARTPVSCRWEWKPSTC